MSMRQLLLGLVVATALPLVALAFFMYQQLQFSERQAARASLMANTRMLTSLVENELDTYFALAAGLAASPELASGDLVTFRQQATKALQAVPGASIGLSDPAGQIVMNTDAGGTQPGAARGDLAVMAKAWATAKPQLSDVGLGPLSQATDTYIEHPVFSTTGAPLYSIIMGLDPERFLELIRGAIGEEITVGIIDRQHKFVARVPDHARRVGTLAAEQWRAEISKAPEGLAETTTLEGRRSLTAYVPTRQGWTVGISYPLEVLDAPRKRLLWSTGLVAAILIGASLFFGLALARHMGRIMHDLAKTAGKVGHGEIVPAGTTEVREANTIHQALSAASRELGSRVVELRASRDAFRQMVENSPFGIYTVDADFRLVQVGVGAQKVFAHVRPLIGRDFAEVLRIVWPEPFASDVIALFRHTLDTGEPYHSPSTTERRNDIDEVESYDWKIERLTLPDGRHGVICHFYDFSERQQLEAALRATEARFRGTFDNAAVGVAHVGLDGRWVLVNQRLCELLGYSAEELSVRTFQDVTHPDDLAGDLEQAQGLMAGKATSYNIDKRYIRKDGSILWTGLTVSLQYDTKGQPDYFIKVIRDITLRKEAQEHQEFLLNELAHRTKNQLAVIQAMANQTRRHSRSLEEFQESFAARIQGLLVATDLLVAQEWVGAEIENLVRGQVAAFQPKQAHLVCEGPKLSVGAEAAQAIGLALHELATNCVKYGAWSKPAGVVTVNWALESESGQPPHLRLSWVERGGPRVVPSKRQGFGRMVIERMVAQKLDSKVEMEFAKAGFRWTVRVPSARLGNTVRERQQ